MAGHGSQSLDLGFYQLIKWISLQSWFEKGLALSLEQPNKGNSNAPQPLPVCCVLN